MALIRWVGETEDMKQLPSCIARMLVAASVAAALILGPHSAHTQVADTTTTSEGPPPGSPAPNSISAR